MPDMKAMGAKTTTSTRVMAMAAKPISLRPLTAASRGPSPFWRWRKMFSRTTIESSTRMPTVSVSPIRLIMFRLRPRKNMTPRVAIRLVGIASSTISVLRKVCRNSSSTMPVRNTAWVSSRWTSLRLLRVKIDVSSEIVMCTSPGSSGCSWAMLFLILSAVSTVLALDCFRMLTPSAGLLFVRWTVLTFL